MSALAALLASFREANAERVLFGPGEVAVAFDGGDSRPVGSDPWARSLLFEAVSELLSQDEIRELPLSRPRIVRHEHEGVDYVIELGRRAGGIAVGVRLGRATLRRDPSVAASRDSFREPLRTAAVAPVLAAATPAETLPRPPSKRLRAIRDKRTVRVDLDEEGVPLDATLDLEALLPPEPAKGPVRRLSKPHRRPSLSNVRATLPALPAAAAPEAFVDLLAEMPAEAPAEVPASGVQDSGVQDSAGRVYETRILPRAGRPTTEAEIAGGPSGAHVTFLFAPGGYALLAADGAIVVVGSGDHAAIGGELFVAPSMKLRINQGPRESIVTFYR